MKTKIMKNFAPLFSLNSNGSIQQWSICVESNCIIKVYGQIGGKMQKIIQKKNSILRPLLLDLKMQFK